MPEDTDTTTDESTEQQTEQQPAVAEVQAQDMPDPKSADDFTTYAESGDESGAASEEQQADEQTADSGADQQAAEHGASAAATDESEPREVNTDETTPAVEERGMLSDLLERAANSVDSLDELQSVAGRSDEFVEGYVEGASAKSEAASERDGLLSWKGETHALAIGIGAGFALGSQGDKRLVGAIVAAGLYGSRGGNRLNDSFAKQVRRELPYAAAGVVIGAVIGLAAAGDLGTALSSVAV